MALDMLFAVSRQRATRDQQELTRYDKVRASRLVSQVAGAHPHAIRAWRTRRVLPAPSAIRAARSRS